MKNMFMNKMELKQEWTQLTERIFYHRSYYIHKAITGILRCAVYHCRSYWVPQKCTTITSTKHHQWLWKEWSWFLVLHLSLRKGTMEKLLRDQQTMRKFLMWVCVFTIFPELGVMCVIKKYFFLYMFNFSCNFKVLWPS